jgi:hypothetical protein
VSGFTPETAETMFPAEGGGRRSLSIGASWFEGLVRFPSNLAPLFFALIIVQMGELRAWCQPITREYEVKAALLFNFCHFVEWPASAVSNTNAPFVIGLLGADPFGSFLDNLVKNERVYGKPFEVRRYRRVEDAVEAHVLFVSKTEQARLGPILSVLKTKPILSVGDSAEPGFARRGGMVNFVVIGRNVRFRINLEETRSAGLSLSPKLLQLAEIVHTERD